MSEPIVLAREQFFMWIGLCITAWAKLEEHLFNICQLSLGTRLDRAALVYCRTPTLDARVKLIDELVRTVLPKPAKKDGGHPHADLKQWTGIRKEIERLLSVRRRIADHPVRGTSAVEEKGDMLFEKTWIELYMSANETLRSGDETDPLDIGDLIRHHHDVDQVRTRAANFERAVMPMHLG
jgi:hypothetical protein